MRCRGLSVGDLAAKAGVPYATLRTYLPGLARAPSVQTGIAIARALDVPVEWLFGESELWPPPRKKGWKGGGELFDFAEALLLIPHEPSPTEAQAAMRSCSAAASTVALASLLEEELNAEEIAALRERVATEVESRLNANRETPPEPPGRFAASWHYYSSRQEMEAWVSVHAATELVLAGSPRFDPGRTIMRWRLSQPSVTDQGTLSIEFSEERFRKWTVSGVAPEDVEQLHQIMLLNLVPARLGLQGRVPAGRLSRPAVVQSLPDFMRMSPSRVRADLARKGKSEAVLIKAFGIYRCSTAAQFASRIFQMPELAKRLLGRGGPTQQEFLAQWDEMSEALRPPF